MINTEISSLLLREHFAAVQKTKGRFFKNNVYFVQLDLEQYRYVTYYPYLKPTEKVDASVPYPKQQDNQSGNRIL